MNTIIMATDFSPAAQEAATYTADLSVALQGTILLLHICDWPTSYTDMPVALVPDKRMEEAADLLAQEKQRLLHHTGGRATIETAVRMGIFFVELKAVCEVLQPWAVALGSQGTTAAQRFIWGGHAVYAMQHLPWPVLAIPPGSKFTGIQKIGFACDFQQVIATTPAEAIKALVQGFGASLHVLNTGSGSTFSQAVIFESGMLQEMLESVRPFYHFIENPRLEEGINEFAEANQLDWLVVLPKRHGFFERMFRVSHTKQLALHCHIPVLALHEAV